MDENKYIGIYYPDTIISNPYSLTTLCLFYDEIHLITISDVAENPTSYLKALPDEIKIGTFGQPGEEDIKRAIDFYQFALNNKSLLDEVLYYHPHLLNTAINEFTNKLLIGKITQQELIDFFFAKIPEIEKLKNMIDKITRIKDEVILRTAATSLNLAEKNNWVLISDNPEIPVPIFSAKFLSVINLTSILANECIKIAIPICNVLNAEEILIAREKLKDQLVPFRMTMQKLSSQLKQAINNSTNIDEIIGEAQFIAKSQVEPAIYEIRRKIEIEKDKLWVKLFGKLISWIPFVAKIYAAPTPDNLFRAMEKIYGDEGDIVNNVSSINIAKEPGISYLLNIQEITKN
ncbi:MAG: hypothetical protein ABSA09_03735 [Desulfobaccales bacterium]|jgi:hypothetical protein